MQQGRAQILLVTNRLQKEITPCQDEFVPCRAVAADGIDIPAGNFVTTVRPFHYVSSMHKAKDVLHN